MATAYLHEAVTLGVWHAWAGQRLAWLHDRLAAGDTPTAASPALAPPAVPTAVWPSTASALPQAPRTPDRPPASAGSLLLALGAVLLVVAGIAFIAFTWDLLGPFGQISVLLALGAACLAATARLSKRLRGTATALGVVGTLLVVIGALGARALGPDIIGETAAMLVSVAVTSALCAAAIWLRPRTAAIGELASLLGATVALTVVATAPSDGAVPLDDPWSWWAALIFGVGGLMLLALADRVHLRGWPWLGALSLFVAALNLISVVEDVTGDAVTPNTEGVVAAATLAVVALVLAALLLPRTRHRGPTATVALALWVLALVVGWVSATSTPTIRSAAAAVLLLTGVLGVAASLHTVGHPSLRLALLGIGSMGVGAAIGLEVAPWVDPIDGFETVDSWASDAWPPWRGVLAGLAFVLVLVGGVAVSPWLGRRISRSDAFVTVAPLVPTAAALGTWLIASLADLSDASSARFPLGDQEPVPAAFHHQVAIAITVLALGLYALALLRRLAEWVVWPAAALAIVGAVIELATHTVDAATEPEVYGIALGLPAGAAAVAWWWLRRPKPTPTWQTIVPPFVLAMGPSTLALLSSAADRWWYGESPDTAYQIRMVGLLTIGVVAVLVGARQRWIGLFFPGLALILVVVGIELIEVGRFLPQWASFGLAGAALIAAGARWEWVRARGRSGAAWVRRMR